MDLIIIVRTFLACDKCQRARIFEAANPEELRASIDTAGWRVHRAIGRRPLTWICDTCVAHTMLGDRRTLAQVERAHIEDTLNLYGGNRTKAAKALGICLRTLRNKLRSYRPKLESGRQTDASMRQSA